MLTIAARFAASIAKAEGFYVKGSIPYHANNPGDLKLGDLGYGLLGEGITVFQTTDMGWDALNHQVKGMLSGLSKYYHPFMTLAETGMKYSGDPNWAKNVAASLGIPETMTLQQIAALPDS